MTNICPDFYDIQDVRKWNLPHTQCSHKLYMSRKVIGTVSWINGQGRDGSERSSASSFSYYICAQMWIEERIWSCFESVEQYRLPGSWLLG